MAELENWTQTLRSPATATTDLPQGDARYQSLGLLGEGGMGRVTEAVDRQFHRVVAVKELKRDRADAEALQRFELEALITGNLEHPGIPAVYERGTRPDGNPFYAMRRVKGRTLADKLAETSGLEERLALLPAVIQAALAVGFAHSESVVHRDLKPQNMVVGPHGEVVVIDWGLARVRGVSLFPSGDHQALAAAEAQAGLVQGTPAYMPPEQAKGTPDALDERTDVFALGAVLYHLLTGRPPYLGADVRETLAQARDARPQPIRKLARGAPQRLIGICERAMSPVPADRYPNATALGEALRGFTTQAISDTSEWGVSLFANVVGFGAMAALLATYLVVSAYLPEFGNYGSPIWLVIALSISGLLTTLVEERTRGRFHLSLISLVIAGATFLATIASMGAQFGLRLDAWRSLPLGQAFANFGVTAIGFATAVGAIGLFQTALQLVAWGVIQRRLLLARH